MTDSLYIRLPNWVGDACMCLPALALLKQSGLPLVLCGRPWAQDLLAGLAPAGVVETGRGLRGDLATLKAGHPAGKQSLAIVFTNSLSSAALFRLAGLRTAGYRGDGRSLFLKWAFSKQPGLHEVEIFYQLARQALARWGVAAAAPALPPPTLRLPITEAHRQAADRALYQAGVDRPFVLLSPTATGLHHGRPKAWPQFGELAASLQRRGWLCIACPPAHEADQARAAVPAAQILPPMGLGAFAALTTKAALVVCNDSGTSHVAAAAGARQITLFGVTRPERTGPWSPSAIKLGSDRAWPELAEVESAALDALASTS